MHVKEYLKCSVGGCDKRAIETVAVKSESTSFQDADFCALHLDMLKGQLEYSIGCSVIPTKLICKCGKPLFMNSTMCMDCLKSYLRSTNNPTLPLIEELELKLKELDKNQKHIDQLEMEKFLNSDLGEPWTEKDSEKGVIKCPKCGKQFHKALYTLGFIHCNPEGCGEFFDINTLEILPKNEKGQVDLKKE